MKYFLFANWPRRILLAAGITLMTTNAGVLGAEITWSDPIDASTNLPVNNGHVIEAVNTGGPEIVINGITFKDGDAGDTITNSNVLDAFPSCCSGNGAPTAPDDDMALMLDSHRWLGTGGAASVATLRLEGLEVGKQYSIQMYYSDFRPGSYKEYYYAGDNASISEMFRRGTTEDNWSFIGTFTADADQQRVHLIPNGTRLDGFVNHDPGNSGYVLSEIVGITGDFNGNGALDVGDIDDLTAQSASGQNNATYDLNADNLVNNGDINVWAKDLKNTWIGDANLDGEFSSGDLVVLFSGGKYETGAAAVWSLGDFNGDGLFTTSDLVSALGDGGYENGPRAAVAAVPEPTTFVLALLGLIPLLRRR